jgi:Bacterial PH domain/Short C-terminal domain
MTGDPQPPKPAGDWWQDKKGRWQRGLPPSEEAEKPASSSIDQHASVGSQPLPTNRTRLEEIKEQIGHLDNASRLLGRREIRELPNILWEDEEIEKLVQGTYGNSTGILVATNKRLVFVDKGIAKLRVEDFPYDKLTSIQYQTGLVMGTVTIFASGNRAEIKNVAKDQCRGFADYVRARITSAIGHAGVSQQPMDTPPPKTTATSVPMSDTVLSQLERLAKLKEQGILTDEEFQAQKDRILAG